MTVGVRLQPVDTLFLRDGTPFDAGGAPQEDVRSLFPPHPSTMVGALRAALARCNGWSGKGRWPERLNSVLGDGPNLGSLRFDGPIILTEGERARSHPQRGTSATTSKILRPLFPIARHLLGTVGTGADEWRPEGYLRPGPAVMCDLGVAVRLPEFPRDAGDRKLKAAPDGWITKAGLESVLRGKRPGADEIVPGGMLWSEERRIGLERDLITRTAREGRLYSTTHVRVASGVSLGIRIDGVPSNGWTWPHGRLVPLGGESRVAECRPWNAEALTISSPLREIEAAGRVALIALTPLDLDEGSACGRELLDIGGGLRVVCACLDRPHGVGGWDSLARRPLLLRSVLPAGSTLFCEVAAPGRFGRIVRKGGGWLRVGRRTEWGFGLAAAGAWPNQMET